MQIPGGVIMSFSIGETIRALRTERAITQERLAEQLNVSALSIP